MEELRATDPVEMRRRANFVLGEILAKRVDPRYRRTALDVLRRLDAEQERAERADRESYRTALAQLAAIDAREGGATKRARSTSVGSQKNEAEIDRIIREIETLVLQRSRKLEPPLALDSRTDPSQATREATQLPKVAPERQGVVSQNALPFPPKEASEAEDLEVLEPSADHNVTDAEASISAGSEAHAPEVKFERVAIPGRFPRVFRLQQRRG
jgi:hypothetical protein